MYGGSESDEKVARVSKKAETETPPDKSALHKTTVKTVAVVIAR